MSAFRDNRKTQGFLLIEMLIALSVIAIMAGLMSRFLGQLGAISRLEAEITLQSELDAGASYLRKILSDAKPVRLLDAEPDTNPMMEGKSGSIRFATITRQGLHALALRDVHLFVSRGQNGNRLLHTVTPRRIANGKMIAPASAISILENIDSLELEYGKSGVWSASWGSDGELPEAIRLRITRNTGKKTITAAAVARIAKR